MMVSGAYSPFPECLSVYFHITKHRNTVLSVICYYPRGMTTEVVFASVGEGTHECDGSNFEHLRSYKYFNSVFLLVFPTYSKLKRALLSA